MIGAFPRRDGWMTLRLAAAPDDDERLVLLELAGRCPGDPDAQPVRVTTCASREVALEQAARRLAAGWAEHAGGDRPAGAAAARAARHAAAWTPHPSWREHSMPAGPARQVVAQAAAARPEPFCLIPNPTARRRPRHQ